MNWNNIDLNSPYESGQNLLDAYEFDTLILEAYCNLREVTPETVRQQAMISIKSKYQEAIEILDANLLNITNHVIKSREMA